MDNLIRNIKANRCILFIGPLMSTHKTERDHWTSPIEEYCSWLSGELTAGAVEFDKSTRVNPYYLAAKYLDGTNTRFESEFTKATGLMNIDPEIYKELAIVPFNTVINFNSDLLLNKALQEKGFEFNFNFYDYRGQEVTHLKVEEDIELVYNLFGSISRRSSRVITEKDQLEFMRKINSAPKLPDDLLGRIREDGNGKKCYIFLGFNFDEWPFRFLLDTLEVPKGEISISSGSEGADIAVMTRDFFNDRFGIQFHEQSRVDFIRTLTKQYHDSAYQHQFAYLDFVPEDEPFALSFREYLAQARLAKRFRFWDRSGVQPSEITNEIIEAEFDKATIYIPFISTKSINNEDFRLRVEKVMKKADALIFPIVTRNCLWRETFPDLESRAAIILPGKDEVLQSSSRTASDEDYLKIIRKINSKIR